MMHGFVKVAAQSLPIRIANPAENARRVIEAVTWAKAEGVHVLCLQELGLTGYTCGDLFFQSTLQSQAKDALLTICKATVNTPILVFVGLPLAVSGRLYSCAAAVFAGKVVGIVPKKRMTAAEQRWFSCAPVEAETVPIFSSEVPFGTELLFCCPELPELKIGCELGEEGGVAPRLVEIGATVICNPTAVPAIAGRALHRVRRIMTVSEGLLCGYLSCSAGEGESTTDGVLSGQLILAENGVLLGAAATQETGRLLSELDVDGLSRLRRNGGFFDSAPARGHEIPVSIPITQTRLTREIDPAPVIPKDEAQLAELLDIQAIALQTRMAHIHAKTALVGLSGGLDSALALLCAVRACDRLNRDRRQVLAVTMPCFGTTGRTRGNAEELANALGVSFRTIPILAAVEQHFRDIGLAAGDRSAVYENAQARERTQVLMDLANQTGGLVVGTGDLSELALGWSTFNGDHMSMYAVNAGLPKTLIRALVVYAAAQADARLRAVLQEILATPISPELLPPENEQIAQRTEELVGPYDLHDFILYQVLRYGFSPDKIDRLMRYALGARYEDAVLRKWLKNFYRRFFAMQFKRSCAVDGPQLIDVSLSPRGGFLMPSDACADAWLSAAEAL